MDSSKSSVKSARIWSFDGGGASVISQLYIVNEIMYQIKSALKLEAVPRPYEYADLMVGTGLGAIVVILLARLRLTAEEALVQLIDLGRYVFIEPNKSQIGTRFDPERLKVAVKEMLGRCGLNENTKLIEDVIINDQPYAAVVVTPASNLSTCRLLRTYPTSSPEYNCTILEAILATMALPEWFPSVNVGSLYSMEKLVGGSVYVNNPTKKALEEARHVFGADHKVTIIMSFGSGQKLALSYENLKRKRSEELMTERMGNDGTANDLSQRFANLSIYHRFSVDLGLENMNIMSWGQTELGTINSHTKTYVEKISSSLAVVVGLLLTNEAVATLGQLTQVNVTPTLGKSVPRLSPYYIPQDDLYKVMEQRLIRDHWETQKVFVIFGIGGSGKTQSTSFFERNNRKRYKYIFFIDASSVASIKVDLQSAVRSLGGMHCQATFEDALRFLVEPKNCDWLVIFDNADDPRIPLLDYLPSCDHGTSIITGRNPDLIRLAPTSHWHLKGMIDADAMKLLLRTTHRQDLGDDEESKSAIELFKLLGGLPLALVQVGFYCHTSKILFTQYLRRFKEHRATLMNMEPSLQLDGYGYSAYASIRLSYSLLDSLALSLLHLLSFLHPANIHIDVLRIAAKYNFEESDWEFLAREYVYHNRLDSLRQLLIPDEEWNEVYIDKLIHELQKISLISLLSSNRYIIITLHPLAQSCVQDTLSAIEYNRYFHMAVHMLASCGGSKEILIFQHLTAHISEIESRRVEIHVNDIAAFAYVLGHAGMHEDSMRKWEKVKEECQRAQGHEHWSTLLASYYIAGCLYHLDRYEEAEEILRKILAVQKRDMGEDDIHTLISYELLALILKWQGRTKEAEVISKRVLAVYQSHYGSEDHRTLRIQSVLADNLFEQRNYLGAETILRNVLPMMNIALGEDDDTTFYASNTLSVALLRQGKWEEAEDILQNLVTAHNRVYGKSHPDTLLVSFNLSLCLHHRNELEEAKRIQVEVLEIEERTLGKNHMSTINTRETLNRTLQAMQR